MSLVVLYLIKRLTGRVLINNLKPFLFHKLFIHFCGTHFKCKNKYIFLYKFKYFILYRVLLFLSHVRFSPTINLLTLRDLYKSHFDIFHTVFSCPPNKIPKHTYSFVYYCGWAGNFF